MDAEKQKRNAHVIAQLGDIGEAYRSGNFGHARYLIEGLRLLVEQDQAQSELNQLRVQHRAQEATNLSATAYLGCED